MSTTAIPATKTKKVLIIEDEGELCLLLNILLDSEDMELDHVKTISAAKDYLKKIQPNVVLLDNRLPDGFGVDFISFIRLHYPSVKIIMMSGFDAAAKDVALYNGADTFLEKPFTKQQLFESVKALLK